MLIIKTRSFELAVEASGIYLRVGRREFDWSRRTGLVR
jgi:hypothetical protein